MALFTIDQASIVGCALALGEEQHQIEEEPFYFNNDVDFLTRLKTTIGISTRYKAAKGTTTLDLCYTASQNLLRALNCTAKDVDALVFITQTPDYLMPGNAYGLHKLLGLSSNAAAFDLSMGCSGFIHGLSLASSLLSHGLKTVLLLAGDVLSAKVNPKNRALAPLFGDAGSATLLTRKINASPMHFLLGADGQGLEKMYVPGGGLRNPLHLNLLANNQDAALNSKNKFTDDLYMDGFGIFQFSMTTQPKVLSDILAYSNLKLTDIDYFLLHQANRYIVKTITTKAGISPEKAPCDIFTRFGNLNSASIPAIMCASLANKLATSNVQVCMQGFGIGLSWGACVTSLNKVCCLPPFCLEKNHA